MPRSDLPHVQHLEKDAQKGARLASIQREAVVRLQVSIHRRQYWRRTCAELQLCTALQQAPRAFSSSMQQQAAAILLPAATADVPKKRVEGAGCSGRRDVVGLAEGCGRVGMHPTCQIRTQGCAGHMVPPAPPPATLPPPTLWCFNTLAHSTHSRRGCPIRLTGALGKLPLPPSHLTRRPLPPLRSVRPLHPAPLLQPPSAPATASR